MRTDRTLVGTCALGLLIECGMAAAAPAEGAPGWDSASERRVFVGTGIASTEDSSGWSLLGGVELVEARRLFLGLEISHDLLEVYQDVYPIREAVSTQVAATVRAAPWPAARVSPYAIVGAGAAVMRLGSGAGDFGIRPAGFAGAGVALRVRSGVELFAQTLVGFRSTTRVRTQARFGVALRP